MYKTASIKPDNVHVYTYIIIKMSIFMSKRDSSTKNHCCWDEISIKLNNNEAWWYQMQSIFINSWYSIYKYIFFMGEACPLPTTKMKWKSNSNPKLRPHPQQLQRRFHSPWPKSYITPTWHQLAKSYKRMEPSFMAIKCPWKLSLQIVCCANLSRSHDWIFCFGKFCDNKKPTQ